MNFNTELLKAMAVYGTFEHKIGDLAISPYYIGKLPIEMINQK
jgi:hypothetical protein